MQSPKMFIFPLFIATALAIPALTNSTSNIGITQPIITQSSTTTPTTPLTTSPPSTSKSRVSLKPISECDITLPGLGAHIGCDITALLDQFPWDFPTGDPNSRFCWSGDWTSAGYFTRDCNRSGKPRYTGTFPGEGPPNSLLDKINNGVDGSLIMSCFTSSQLSKASWFATAPITVGSVLPATVYVTTHYTYSYSGNWPAETPYYYTESFSYTAVPPCCLRCTLFGGTVDVIHWPTTTESPPISTLTNEVGFTL